MCKRCQVSCPNKIVYDGILYPLFVAISITQQDEMIADFLQFRFLTVNFVKSHFILLRFFKLMRNRCILIQAEIIARIKVMGIMRYSFKNLGQNKERF